MDPVSQAALGASWAQSVSRGRDLRDAGVLGAVSGMAADLDALIHSSSDPLLFMEYHRHFTHALAFVPLGALLCAALLHRIVRTRLSFARTYLFCFLGYGSHGLLDACTTYGTQLLWPFSDSRVAWSVVAVFDPLFTAPVLALVLLAAAKRSAGWAYGAAAYAVVYLALGAVQSQRALEAGAALASSRGHSPVRIEATPSLGNVILWKVIYEHDGRYYVDAVRAGLATRVYPGESTPKLDLAKHFPWLEPGSQQAIDVERFRRLSDDLLSVDGANRVVDLRYSMVPNEIAPFWAIVLDRDAAPDEHVELVATRERTPEHARRLLAMLFQRARPAGVKGGSRAPRRPARAAARAGAEG